MPPIKFPIGPAFVLYCDGAITEVSVVTVDNQELIAVGTQEGTVRLYNFDDYHLESVVYEDANKSSILKIIQIDENIVIHVRGHYVVILKKDADNWKEIHSHPVDFPGFCKIAYLDGKILLPLSQNGSTSAVIANITSNAVDSTDSQPISLLAESASPSCSAVDLDSHSFYLGDDMGVLTVIKTSKHSEAGEVTQVQLCKCPIFALASNAEYIAAGSSANEPIFLLKKNDLKGARIVIPYIQNAGGINSLCFSPSGTTLFGGFWDGQIRGYAVKKQSIILVLSLHDEIFNLITWLDPRRFAAGSKEGRLSIWDIR